MKTDEKPTHTTENLKSLTAFMMDQTNNSKFSPSQKDALTPTETITMVLDKRRSPTLDGGQSTKIGGMWTLKHDARSRKFYELLIKT